MDTSGAEEPVPDRKLVRGPHQMAHHQRTDLSKHLTTRLTIDMKGRCRGSFAAPLEAAFAVEVRSKTKEALS